MTTLPAYLVDKKKIKVPEPKLLTFEDYARLTPPESGNYELHNGKIVFMPSPIDIHQQISLALSARLYYFVLQNKLGKVFTAPMDTIFTKNDTLQPDILFISKERENIIERQIKGAPDFIIEILSDGNTAKEMSYKKYIYETTGVKEYWLVNPNKKTITQYINIEGDFFPKNIVKTEGVITSEVITGFNLPVADIF